MGTSAISTDIEQALADVPIEVTVRLTAERLPLRDIVGLQPGDVLSFDKPIGEPVELIAAGRVVALGELVTVEGQLGIRILEIASEASEMEAERG